MSALEPPPTNPYEAPRVQDSAAADAALVLSREEIEAFVGNRPDHFWSLWRRHLGAPATFVGFSWPATILNGAWLLYRKMYREAGVFLVATFAAAALVTLAEHAAGEPMPQLGRALNAILAIGVGALGNGLYLRRARRVVAEVRRLDPDPAARLALLRRRGGVSYLWPTFAFLALIGLGALAGSMAG